MFKPETAIEGTRAWVIVLIGIVVIFALGFFAGELRARPPIPKVVPILDTTLYDNAVFDAAKVFGRVAGCGTLDLAKKIARQSVAQGVPANLIAATMCVESHGDPLAVSNKGAVGLMQIRIVAHKTEYDFKTQNPFDADVSLQIGTQILKAESAQGWRHAVLRYNADDAAYADKVLQLAGIR